MSDPDNYPLGYYDNPIRYPDPRGKEDVDRGSIEGEGDQAVLVPSTMNNDVTFPVKSGKNGEEVIGINKISKGSIEI